MKTEAGTVVKGFFVFKVVAKNSNDAKKTLKGKITLQAADGSVAGECTIYMELPAGQQAEKELKCKETGPWEKFEAVIEKIFNF